jgi:hypothetical protein
VAVVALRLIAARGLVGAAASGFDRLLWRLGRDEAIATSPDQVLPPSLDQGFPDREVIVRLEKRLPPAAQSRSFLDWVKLGNKALQPVSAHSELAAFAG